MLFDICTSTLTINQVLICTISFVSGLLQ